MVAAYMYPLLKDKTLECRLNASYLLISLMFIINQEDKFLKSYSDVLCRNFSLVDIFLLIAMKHRE